MRFRLLLLFCFISVSASAQWWHIDLSNLGFKKHEVLTVLKPVKDHSVSCLVINSKPSHFEVEPLILARSQYSLEQAEAEVMKDAKHHMRFREYNIASYNFNGLANVYVQLHRFSEAKWYFLQSLYLSRQQNDYNLTVRDLVSLAGVKVSLGDKTSARADLVEARDIAHSNGMLISVIQLDDKIQLFDQNGTMIQNPDVQYAETTEISKKIRVLY